MSWTLYFFTWTLFSHLLALIEVQFFYACLLDYLFIFSPTPFNFNRCLFNIYCISLVDIIVSHIIYMTYIFVWVINCWISLSSIFTISILHITIDVGGVLEEVGVEHNLLNTGPSLHFTVFINLLLLICKRYYTPPLYRYNGWCL